MFRHRVLCTWQLFWLAAKQPLSVLTAYFSPCKYRNCSSPGCRASISGIGGSFQSGETTAGRRALTIKGMVVVEVGNSKRIADIEENIWLKFPVLAPTKSGNIS